LGISLGISKILLHHFEDLQLLACDYRTFLLKLESLSRHLVHMGVRETFAEERFFLQHDQEIGKSKFLRCIETRDLASNLIQSLRWKFHHIAYALQNFLQID
jgi:hypothetical protein